MTITRVDLFRYALPLDAPLQLGDRTIQRRRGLLVRLQTKDGTEGWGDAAPLPAFSPESLDEVVEVAQSVASAWTGTTLSRPAASLGSWLKELPSRDEGLASLQFAWETAALDLIAQHTDTSLPAVLGAQRSTVGINGLIVDPLDTGEKRARALRTAGYRSVKVKVGRGAIAEEAEAIRVIRGVLGPDIALRLDANRAWSMDEAVAFARAIEDTEVAYIEEPLANPSRLDELARKTSLPLALDESTRELAPALLRAMPSVSAVVLKPTLLGGVETTLQWMAVAEEIDVTPVISGAYESGIGVRMLLALAAAGPATATGLSPYARLSADVLASPLDLEGPSVDTTAVFAGELQVEASRLHPITAMP